MPLGGLKRPVAIPGVFFIAKIYGGMDPHKFFEKNKKQKSPFFRTGFFNKNVGGDLLSHQASPAVPSALKSLASEFGMGSGVPSSL